MAFGPPEYADSTLAGIDFSWVAVDKDGHVAWLVTFGSAVVPPWVERASDAFADAERLLAALPERGSVGAAQSTAAVRQWLEAGRRGVFGYDWSVYDGPYALVARPANPINVAELPPELGELASRSRFEHLCFSEAPELKVDDIRSCRARPKE